MRYGRKSFLTLILVALLTSILSLTGCGSGSKGGSGGGGGNTSPTATITLPSDGSTYTEGDIIDFSGSGADTEDGALTGSSLGWTSSIDGKIGTGTSFTGSGLSVGTHTITLTATDSQGATGTDSVSITINASGGGGGNTSPTATITLPSDGSTYTEGDIDFSGTGDDAEDGALTGSSLGWTSSIDGKIGTGTSFTRSGLSVGTQTITLTATDSQGATGTDSVSITINARNTSGGGLPDTGQTACYDASGVVINCTDTGQDGEYSINPMSFTDNGNGTVTDNVTGLMWQQKDDNKTRTWANAGTYCDGLALVYTDWRLPTEKELMSIVNYGTYSPAIDATAFPSTKASNYWSSTTVASNAYVAWYVSFNGGGGGGVYKGSGYSVRCVR